MNVATASDRSSSRPIAASDIRQLPYPRAGLKPASVFQMLQQQRLWEPGAFRLEGPALATSD
jgi:hypothetical protein